MGAFEPIISAMLNHSVVEMNVSLFFIFIALLHHFYRNLNKFTENMGNDPKHEMFKFFCQHVAVYALFNGTLCFEVWRQNFAIQFIQLIKSAFCWTVWYIQWRQSFYTRVSIEYLNVMIFPWIIQLKQDTRRIWRSVWLEKK